jgi:mono/diheme cytochrome c family protein
MTFLRNCLPGLKPGPAGHVARPAGYVGESANARPGFSRAVLLCVVGLFAAGCRQDMHDTPRYEAYEATDQVTGAAAARIAPAGTVARGLLRADEALYTGKIDGQVVDAIPFAISHADLKRGQERYAIYCTPCHGELGDGNGMVVERGLRQAASYHQDRLRQERIGYFFDVITNGFGAMQGYAEQVPVRDRWLIAAYIRALQFSQNATVADVPAERRGEFGSTPGQAPPPAGTAPPASGSGQPPQRPEGTRQ